MVSKIGWGKGGGADWGMRREREKKKKVDIANCCVYLVTVVSVEAPTVFFCFVFCSSTDCDL